VKRQAKLKAHLLKPSQLPSNQHHNHNPLRYQRFPPQLLKYKQIKAQALPKLHHQFHLEPNQLWASWCALSMETRLMYPLMEQPIVFATSVSIHPRLSILIALLSVMDRKPRRRIGN
jgi:hypothetical protein